MADSISLKDDSFADSALAQVVSALWVGEDGRMTNCAQLLVRQTDVRSDESGNHPGEVFAMVSITQEELRAMLQFLEDDWQETTQACGDVNTPEKIAVRIGKAP